MKRLLSFLFALLLSAAGAAEGASAGGLPDRMRVGTDIPFGDITDFYYTLDASTDPPHYQRFRFYAEGGTRYFYHETREGGGWPQTEAYITTAGTAELTEEQWAAVCGLLEGGIAEKRGESPDDGDGDAGPWMFIYWSGGEAEGREFVFDPRVTVIAFEEYCLGLAGSRYRRIRVTDGTSTIVYRPGSGASAKCLYEMLPLDAEVQDYGSKRKNSRPGGTDPSEGFALFYPWINTLMYYDSPGASPRLFILGQAEEGADQVKNLSGTVHIEALE